MRCRRAAELALVVSLFSAPVGATKPARACIDAHAEGQVERDAGRLLRARERFSVCAAESCPALIRKECSALSSAVEATIPSIVVVAQDTRGRPTPGARAKIDGSLRAPGLDGATFELDPGPHRVEMILPDGRSQAFDLDLESRQKGRRVVATFPEGTPAKQVRSSGNELAYVLGGAGLLALGAWGAFAWDGSRKQAALETCAPRCTNRSQLDAMRRSYLIADVLLGVSLASLGTSSYLLITSSLAEDNRTVYRSVVVGAQGSF